jgi:D-alanyl-lipoteichoic acid acyltransferase DltB (MBOAT superfamily)
LRSGLFKKTVLADGHRSLTSAAPSRQQGGGRCSHAAGVGAVLAYTLQLYFDFSGYSDMAIGLSRCSA